MSALADLLAEQRRAKGNWTMRRLAAESGVSQSNLSKIQNIPGHVPDLPTLAKLAKALDLPLKVLVEACGYNLDQPGQAQDPTARVEAITSAVPELKELFLQMVDTLTPDDREAMLVYLESARAHRAKKK